MGKRALADTFTEDGITVSSVPDPAFAYRVPAVAEMLTVSTATIWRLIARRELEAKRIGGATVILRSDLMAYLDASGAPQAK